MFDSFALKYDLVISSPLRNFEFHYYISDLAIGALLKAFLIYFLIMDESISNLC